MHRQSIFMASQGTFAEDAFILLDRSWQLQQPDPNSESLERALNLFVSQIFGRTTHSRFGIPLNINEDSCCNIRQESQLVQLICKSKLIIWYEAPMTNKYSFEALDKTLRDVLRLTKNMRLQTSCQDSALSNIREFSEWILNIGDGEIGDYNDGEGIVEISDDLLIKDSDNPLAERTILAPTIEIVQTVNDFMLSLVAGEELTYFSSDSACKADVNVDSHEDLYTIEFLNFITSSGLPNSELKLKKLRLLVGHKVFIPRMMLSPLDSRLPLFQRRQYSLAICFAMTINKSQGQSLSHVGLYLSREEQIGLERISPDLEAWAS
ncbi:uncharacterized protein LOC119981842 [Tripterygium wilfordii]|uniref:uncharacterized protein LOC119981842 n=1 Tax=Tripterygium wilfordii TaxID=458696 RepID=UPI0018F83DEE|nr:uncharacterized protein LOC119981842 [Tripterygium wilfordii]